MNYIGTQVGREVSDASEKVFFHFHITAINPIFSAQTNVETNDSTDLPVRLASSYLILAHRKAEKIFLCVVISRRIHHTKSYVGAYLVYVYKPLNL